MQIEGVSVKPLFLKNLGRVFLRSGHRSISFFSKNRDQGEDKCDGGKIKLTKKEKITFTILGNIL